MMTQEKLSDFVKLNELFQTDCNRVSFLLDKFGIIELDPDTKNLPWGVDGNNAVKVGIDFGQLRYINFDLRLLSCTYEEIEEFAEYVIDQKALGEQKSFNDWVQEKGINLNRKPCEEESEYEEEEFYGYDDIMRMTFQDVKSKTPKFYHVIISETCDHASYMIRCKELGYVDAYITTANVEDLYLSDIMEMFRECDINVCCCRKEEKDKNGNWVEV